MSVLQNTSSEIDRKLSNSYNNDHPFTKTVINTIRSESKERLFRFLKTDPYFLDRHFQMFDIPDKLTGCSTDRLSVFRTKAVLYLDPLCIAIYFRKSTLIKYILDLGGNVNHENYATGIFYQKTNTQDFMQFPPLCVLIRREFIDGLITLMQHFPMKLGDTRISTFYLNSEIERVITYDDILSYTITVLKARNSYPLKRLISVLLKHEIQVRQIDICSKEFKELAGLFLLKLTRATLNDAKLKMIASLITALEQVVNSAFNNKNLFPQTVTLAELKKGFCSDIVTHYNFTGLVCLHILYQRCLEWGRIGFDHMIISLINNLLVHFSWRPIFLDSTCHSHIHNLMHVTSSNLLIDTVEKSVFMRIMQQVKKMKEDEESRVEWIMKVRKKYNAHRGTYSKAPNMSLSNDGDATADSCHSQSSGSYSNAETEKVTNEDATCTSPKVAPKVATPEPLKPRGLPIHLLTRTIPYWKPQDNVIKNSYTDVSSDEEYEPQIARNNKKKSIASEIQSIVVCKQSSNKNSTLRQLTSLDASKSTGVTKQHHFKRSKNGSSVKTPVLSSCSYSYPIEDDDIMGPVAHYSPISKGIMKADDIDVIFEEKLNSKTNHNAVANWLMTEKPVNFNNESKISNNSVTSIHPSPNRKSTTYNLSTQSTNNSVSLRNSLRPNKQYYAPTGFQNVKEYNNSSSVTALHKQCILHSRDRFRSSAQYSSLLRR